MTNFLTALCKKLHPEPKGWAFQYGNPGLKLLPANNTFTFPSAPDGSVNYLTRLHTTPLLHKIRLICRIVETPGTVWDFRTAPDNTGTHPASVRLFFQHKDDDMSGKGDKQYYRWWSNPGHIVLADGQFELSVPIDHTQWTSVYGKTDAEQFLNCCTSVGRVGCTFGGGSFFGHGVRVTGGSATFEILEFLAL